MNANELADELENTYPFVGVMEIAATMLRQQQTEIEALKGEIVSIEKNTDYWADKANWIKNNEPVAKVTEHGIYLEYPFGLNLKIGTLLYTHPPKELTDEEILNLWWDSDHTKDEDDLILTFVKRILKER
jgi:hypothetical protein